MDLSQFKDHKYINLETYKKNGQAVDTPVWFTLEGERIFVVTRSETGKVKRLKNNPRARIMPCGMRGEPKGGWVEANVRLATPEELQTALKQRGKKYGIKAKIAGLFSSGRGNLVALSITLDSNDNNKLNGR
jgi:PPOX class probable F420-dependent enzyme